VAAAAASPVATLSPAVAALLALLQAAATIAEKVGAPPGAQPFLARAAAGAKADCFGKIPPPPPSS